jgi:hypothetical protein
LKRRYNKIPQYDDNDGVVDESRIHDEVEVADMDREVLFTDEQEGIVEDD